MVRVLDLQPIGHRFESRPLHIMTHGKLFFDLPLITKQYKVVRYQRKLGAKQALYATYWLWTCIFSWCLAESYRNGVQRNHTGPCGSEKTLVIVAHIELK